MSQSGPATHRVLTVEELREASWSEMDTGEMETLLRVAATALAEERAAREAAEARVRELEDLLRHVTGDDALVLANFDISPTPDGN